jgi:hypothetical protein
MLPPAYNDVLQIIQTPGYVLVIREMETAPRLIPPTGDRTSLKHPAVGRRLARPLGGRHARRRHDELSPTRPRSGSQLRLHVVERFTRVSADRILYQFTVDDPETWTRPWSAEIPMIATKGPLYEYACHEGNYGMPDILRGARYAEKEAAEAAARDPRKEK